ncbi:MAG: helix-turn-helix domain-containing protein [Magnetococcus sp. WYHC-3]
MKGLGGRIGALAESVGGKKALASLSHISESLVHRYVSGQSVPGTVALVNIARAAGVTVDWLATGSGGDQHAAGESALGDGEELLQLVRMVLQEVEGKERAEKYLEVIRLAQEMAVERDRSGRAVRLDENKIARLARLIV